MTIRTCPTETEEEIALSDYCNLMKLRHFHVPQETYTTSWKQKAKNKAQGVSSGVSDHWIVVPTKSGKKLVVIELKRQFGNTPSDEQISFINDINEINNVEATVCYGADEAINVIQGIVKGDYGSYNDCQKRMKKIEENRKNRAKIKKSVKNEKNVLPY